MFYLQTMACKCIYKTHRILNRPFVNTTGFKLYSTDANDKNKRIVDGAIYPKEEVTKESLQWRTTWSEKGEWYSKLNIFASEHNNVDVIKFLQSPIDFWPSTIIKWLKKRRDHIEKHLQQYIPERNAILGNELAAAHFIVYRGGAVKFFGEPNWVKKNENDEYNLPSKYVPNKIVQAIDCSNVYLFYEGLDNFRNLQKIEWLKLKGCENMDDWCMDRISGSIPTLKYLDIRNCKNITERGIGALYRTKKLETLLIDDMTKTKSLELTCLMLLELLPRLKIKSQD